MKIVKKENNSKNSKRKNNIIKIINDLKLLKFILLFLLLLFYFKRRNNNTDININTSIIDYYKNYQIDFCNYPNKYINNEVEKNIKLYNVYINGSFYQMYASKKEIGLSKDLSTKKIFEKKESLNILNAFILFYLSNLYLLIFIYQIRIFVFLIEIQML